MTSALFASLSVYHDIDSRSAALNMAMDEALLEIAAIPTIRFYQWDHPALSFGYFGKFEEVMNYNRDIVRRWTGGGIVFHGEDLTYSIVIPSGHPAFGESATSIYERVHRAICDVFNENGKRAELVSVAAVSDRRGRKESAIRDRRYNNCFANPVCADVISHGRKIAGAAQRRTRRGLLQQGSIQLATGRVRVATATGNVDLGGFADSFAKNLCDECRPEKLNNALLALAEEIAERKYGTDSWLLKR
jgi:lipoyl(octanoyl) transferase